MAELHDRMFKTAETYVGDLAGAMLKTDRERTANAAQTFV
jgi:hypothetical protein